MQDNNLIEWRQWAACAEDNSATHTLIGRILSKFTHTKNNLVSQKWMIIFSSESCVISKKMGMTLTIDQGGNFTLSKVTNKNIGKNELIKLAKVNDHEESL